MLFDLRSQKLYIYFLIYAFLKAKFIIIEIEKLNSEKGKKLNFIEENFFQKEKLYFNRFWKL
jgi:hypothetical protein